MSNKISDLKPRVAAAAMRALADLRARGVSFSVTSTLRTEAEQAALYAQGREPLADVNAKRVVAGMRPIVQAENKYTVTNADGVKHKSNHQGGTALDVVPEYDGRPVWPPAHDERWSQISGVFKKYGFEWGGDWKDFPDLPHYQWKVKV